jgi:hypothetical protein
MPTDPHTLADNSLATDLQFSESSLFDSDLATSSSSSNTSDSLHTNTSPIHTDTQTSPLQLPSMNPNFPNPFHSVLTMPIPGTKLAPEKFRGDFHKVKEFIQHYERLCTQNNVVLDTEKCDTLLRYCSKREKQTIKNIPSYTAKSWGRLREDILRLYDADLDTRRYKVSDVRNFSKKQKAKKIRDLAGWKKYCRAFLRIAGSLLRDDKISDKEYATYFWQGIPRALRVRLESRILSRDPVRDLSEPFEVDEIDTAASAVLQRDRFDRALDDSDSEDGDSSDDESSSGSEDESSDSESEDEREKRRRRARKKRSSKSRSRRSSSEKEDRIGESRRRVVKGPHKEVESLIKQMNLLTQDDPQYGIAYYRALKLDPDVARIVAEPALRRPCDQQQFSAARVTTYPQPRYSQPVNPSYYAPRAPLQISQQPPPRGSEMMCYGCGEKGHGMTRCSIINDMIMKDLLAKDSGGRIVHKDGSPIRRMSNETYVQAYERERPPQSHLIMVASDSDSDDEYGSNEVIGNDRYYDQEMESDVEDVFAVRDVGWETFVADRPEKKIAARQKMVMDGVYPPRLKDISKGKENRPADPETGRPIRSGKAQGTRPAVIKEPMVKPRNVVEPMEVDSHEPRYDGTKDSQIIEDTRTKGREVLKRTQEEVPDEAKAPDKRLVRKSAVSEHVNLMNVLNQVLSAKVELAVGEIIGVSRELSGQLSNAIKFKSAKQPEAVGLTTIGNMFKTKTRGLLIKITMECDGYPIQAIIDTGSQLNIVSEKVCKAKIRRPIDCSATLSMNDANGGEGKLTGFVENVPLDFGSVKTRANLYVGAHVPFDLLLGRPWQRGNLVSIDELEDGTYLVFKDPGTLDPKHKVLVTPDAVIDQDWDFDPSTWCAADELKSFIVDCGKDAQAEKFDEEYEKACQVPWRLRKDYPEMEQYEFPSLFMGMRRNMSELAYEIFKPWLQRILLHLILRRPNRVMEWNDELQEWLIKELGKPVRNPPVYSPRAAISNCDMQIKLGPAAVKHEADLAALFATTDIAGSEAEAILAGLGDLPNLSRNQHFRDIILSSHDGVVIDHCTDESGYRRTDLMLFRMGLITPKSPGSNNGTDLDVQYGAGLIHFYPNLGGEAPRDWQIPYLFPPPTKTSVSCQTTTDADTSTNKDNTQVGSGTAVTSEPPPRPKHPLSIVATACTAGDSDESTDEDEGHLPCSRCLSYHDDPCSGPVSTSVPSTRSLDDVSSKAVYHHGDSTESLPSLEYVTDTSDMDDNSDLDSDTENSSSKWSHRWNQFKAEIDDELRRERDERLAEWDTYQEEKQAEREKEREEEISRSLEDEPFRKRVNGQSADPPSSTPSDCPMSPNDSSGPPSPAHSPSIPLPRTLDPRLPSRKQSADKVLEPEHLEIRTIEPLSPDGQVSVNRIRRGSVANLSAKMEGINLEDPKTIIAQNHLKKSLLFTPPPVQVYSVHIPAPSFHKNYIRPPTPFPDSELLSPPERMQQRGEQNDMSIDSVVKREQETPVIETPPPAYEEEPQPVVPLEPDKISVEQGRRRLPRVVLTLSKKENTPESDSCSPSPTDTERIDDLMLPPARRQLPRPPVYLRPNHYRQARDDFLEGSRWQPNGAPYPCFSPHILALTRDRVLHPFIETNRPGPVTDRSIPIEERTYYPYADMDVHYNIARVDRFICVDTRDFTIVPPQEAPPGTHTVIFSVLAPRNAPHGLVFPGQIWPDNFGPYELPRVSARTLGERYQGLKRLRHSITGFIKRVRQSLTTWQLEEIESPLITLYTIHGNRLVEKKVNRGMFFRIMHPNFNPLVSNAEATFLRGACYALQKFQHDLVASTIDHLLRSPQMDVHMCTKLRELGCLDDDRRDKQGYEFLEHYEDMAQGDRYEDVEMESEDSD